MGEPWWAFVMIGFVIGWLSALAVAFAITRHYMIMHNDKYHRIQATPTID